MRESIIGLVAIAAIAAPIAFATAANAAVTGTYTTGFGDVAIDPTAGASNDHWRMTGGYDATITGETDPALQITNPVTSGGFGDQLFSPTLAEAATETGPVRTFTASFVLEPVQYQEGLRVTVSPDNGQGGRGGFLAIEHKNGGLDLVSQGSYMKQGELQWNVTNVATGLDPTKPHTVKLTLVKKLDTKTSTNNDLFSVQVDRKTAKNTTFEAYYDATGEDNYQTDTLLFRLSGTAQPQLFETEGLLIDDVTIATS